MGAYQFETSQKGATPTEAFCAARDQALWDYGHAGYTGTIAEKDGYELFSIPTGHTLEEVVEALARSYDVDNKIDWLPNRMIEVYNDKWGPAVCLPAGEGEWLFTGFASS